MNAVPIPFPETTLSDEELGLLVASMEKLGGKRAQAAVGESDDESIQPKEKRLAQNAHVRRAVKQLLEERSRTTYSDRMFRHTSTYLQFEDKPLSCSQVRCVFKDT